MGFEIRTITSLAFDLKKEKEMIFLSTSEDC
jgi:hypothetical protein